MSMAKPSRDDWEFDDECPECAEEVYLTAIIKEMDDKGAVRATLHCGEEYYRINDIPGFPVEHEGRGCGHSWDWQREQI